MIQFTIAVSLLAATAAAQTAVPSLTTLYSFTSGDDGANPQSALVAGPDGTLYGTTFIGGPWGRGALFSLTPPAAPGGTWTPTVIHTFQGRGDGANPVAPLIMDKSGALYGTSIGSNGVSFGNMFKFTPPATPGGPWTETVLWNCTVNGGIQPLGALFLTKNGTLIGTNRAGGAYGSGTVFTLTPPAPGGGGWSYNVIYHFTGLDGAAPGAKFIAGKSGSLYSTTYRGGATNFGTVFKLTPPATPGGAWTETVLYHFTGGADGGNPVGSVIAGAGGVLFGTTQFGGASGLGAVYSLTPPATPGGAWTETVLYSFTGGADGAEPYSDLLLTKTGALIGTTSSGGTAAAGTVFTLVPPVTAGGAWMLKTLHSFTGGLDGANPYAGIIAVAGANAGLYGTTGGGGAGGMGSVFQLR